MQKVEEYVQRTIDAHDKLVETNMRTSKHSDNVTSNLNMLEDLALVLAREIDKLKEKIK